MLKSKKIGQAEKSMLDYCLFRTKGGTSMNSKRIKFALFISVFALYGCASGSKSTSTQTLSTANITTINKTDAAQMPALHTTEMMNITEDVSALSLMANDASVSQRFSTLLQNRDVKGSLRTQKAIKNYSVKMNQRIRKKQQEQAKREARTFTPMTTTYGVDCYGCGGEDGRGGTSLGVTLDADMGVMMPDGSWQRGIRYGKYYIIAADPSIPLCSIIKISNHGLSGSGISPDKPYYAIVLDRGGAIYGSHLDLYIGRENSGAIVKVKQTTPKAEIIRVGGKSGPRSCAL